MKNQLQSYVPFTMQYMFDEGRAIKVNVHV